MVFWTIKSRFLSLLLNQKRSAYIYGYKEKLNKMVTYFIGVHHTQKFLLIFLCDIENIDFCDDLRL